MFVIGLICVDMLLFYWIHSLQYACVYRGHGAMRIMGNVAFNVRHTISRPHHGLIVAWARPRLRVRVVAVACLMIVYLFFQSSSLVSSLCSWLRSRSLRSLLCSTTSSRSDWTPRSLSQSYAGQLQYVLKTSVSWRG